MNTLPTCVPRPAKPEVSPAAAPALDFSSHTSLVPCCTSPGELSPLWHGVLSCCHVDDVDAGDSPHRDSVQSTTSQLRHLPRQQQRQRVLRRKLLAAGLNQLQEFGGFYVAWLRLLRPARSPTGAWQAFDACAAQRRSLHGKDLQVSSLTGA